MKKTSLLKRIVVTMLLATGSTYSHAQWQDMDVVSELDSTQQPSPIIYLTATWCLPCMEKLPTIIDSFGHNPQRPLFVVFDRTGLGIQRRMRLSVNYDTTYFRSLPAMYLPQSVKRLVTIDVNSANTVFRNLTEDLNHTWNARFKKDEVWVGTALLLRRNKVYVTRQAEKAPLVQELKQAMAE